MKKLWMCLILTAVITLFGISVYASTTDALSAYSEISYAQSVSGAEYESPHSGQLKNEQDVKEISGALEIRSTDLVLPGKPDLDVVVQRRYNSMANNGMESKKYGYKYSYVNSSGNTKYCYVLFATEQDMYDNANDSFVACTSSSNFTEISNHTGINSSDKLKVYVYEKIVDVNFYTDVTLTRVKTAEPIMYEYNEYYNSTSNKTSLLEHNWDISVPRLYYVTTSESVPYGGTSGDVTYSTYYKHINYYMFVDEIGQITPVQYEYGHYKINYNVYYDDVYNSETGQWEHIAIPTPTSNAESLGQPAEFVFGENTVYDGYIYNNNRFVVHDKERKVTYYFDGGLSVAAKQNRFGDEINYEYTVVNSKSKLSKITDSYGRIVNFSYNTEGKLTSVSYGGKSITYSYGYDDKNTNLELDDEYTCTVTNETGESTVYKYQKKNISSVYVGIGNNRDASGFRDMYVITEIQYPTGGKTVYEYEKHEKTVNNNKTTDYRVSRSYDVIGYEESNVYSYTYDCDRSDFTSINLPFTDGFYTIVKNHRLGDDADSSPYDYYYIYTFSNNLTQKYQEVNGTYRNEQTNTYKELSENGSPYYVLQSSQEHEYMTDSTDRGLNKTTNYSHDIEQTLLSSSDEHSLSVWSYINVQPTTNIYYYKHPVTTRVRLRENTDNDKTDYPYVQKSVVYVYDGHAEGSTMKNLVPSSILVWEDKVSESGAIKNGAGELKERIFYEYNDDGQVIKEKRMKNPVSGEVSETAEYDITNYSYTYDEGYGTDVTKRRYETVTKTTSGIENGVYNANMTVSTTTVYDYYGNVVETYGYGVDDAKFEYDAANRVTKQTLKKHGGTDQSVTQYSYNVGNNTSTTVTAPDGTKTKVNYDGLGRYSSTQVYQNNSPFTTESVTYNENGKIFTKKVAKSSNEWYNITYRYWSSGKLKLEQVKDSSGSVLRQNNYAYGEAVADTDEYDANTEKITLTSLIDGSTNRKVEAFVDPWGLTRKTIVYNGSSQYVTTYKYDKYNALVSMTDPNSNASDKSPTVSYEYDYNMNVIRETNALGDSVTSTYNALGQLVESTDYMGTETQYYYDGVGNLVRTTSPIDNNNTAETLQYYNSEGMVVKEKIKTDINSYRETDYTYDELGRLSAVIKDETTGDNYTKYFYDVKGNPIKVVTGLTADCTETTIPETAAVTQYEYHPYFNSITKITKPDGTIQYFNYDLFGLLTEQGYTKNNTNSGQIYYTYDILGQLTSKTAGDETETFAYDKLGRMTTKSDSTGWSSFEYDEAGRMTKETNHDLWLVKEYGYDRNGNRTSFRLYKNLYDIQQDLVYNYDKLNRVYRMYSDGYQTALYTYDKNSNLLTEDNNVVNTAYTYNAGNFVTSKVTSNSAGTVLQTDNYTYKSDGNVGTENDKTYTYDTQNRLSNVLKGTNNTSYTFDERGNRSVKMYNGNNSYTYTYDKNNKLLQFDDGTYRSYPSYDDRGNLVFQTVATYDYGVTVEYFDASYDGFNRLESVVTFSDSAQYEYNSDGIRTAKTVNGTRTEFVLDGINVIAENKDGSFTDYIRGVTGLIYLKKPNGTKLYYVKNNHGDVTKLVNESGTVVESYTYDEFGNTYMSDTNPFGYCGEYYDTETGMVYLRARYYDPEIGRFISEDPIRDDLNWYVYCGSNPINFWDPLGLVVTDWDRQHCTPEELKQLEQNDKLWINGNENQKEKAAKSSRKIREKHVGKNDVLLDNGYVETTFTDNLDGKFLGGDIEVLTEISYRRLYTENGTYTKLIYAKAKVNVNNGVIVDKIHIIDGQGGIRSKTSVNEYATTYREHFYSPDWEYILDDGGICTTVGLNITVYARDGNKKHNVNVINQMYTQQIFHNGDLYTEGIDFRDILVEALQRGER